MKWPTWWVPATPWGGHLRPGHHRQDDPRDDAGPGAGHPEHHPGAAGPAAGGNSEKRKITIPWFVPVPRRHRLQFRNLLPAELVDAINTLDTFLLTMAMTALGTESSFEKFKKAGARPFLLAASCTSGSSSAATGWSSSSASKL